MASDASIKLRLPGGRRVEAVGIWNISLGGVFVELAEPLSFGEELHFEFALVGQAVPLHCKGFVVWSTKDSPDKARGKKGAGVRLTDLGIAEMRAIAGSVGQKLAA